MDTPEFDVTAESHPGDGRHAWREGPDVTVESHPSGGYHAWCEGLDHCGAYGRTEEDAVVECIKLAIARLAVVDKNTPSGH